ncbi:MAG: metallophosphoesterase [Pseudomonadota bacterium]
MRLQIASDLHLEFIEQSFPEHRVVEPADADVLILAGDIHNAARGIDAFKDWPVPVIYVHGNHEAYDSNYDDMMPALRASAAQSGVHFLERDELVFKGVRFLGCCLWTDYCLQEDAQAEAMQQAEACLLDHQCIETGDGGKFSTQHALRIHAESRAWLAQKLDQAFDGPTVVITHHGPHPGSIHPRYAGNPLNAAFISNLTPLVEKASLWIHGHVHDSFDYQVNGARVIANPRGYAKNRRSADTPDALEWENPAFNKKLVVEV